MNNDQRNKIASIAERTIQGMRHEGTPFQGCLYLGLMLAEERGGDPVVIEYNVRFGDPETQVVLPLVKNVYEHLRSAAGGDLYPDRIKFMGGAALSVCLAADGYPESPRKGDVIHGLDRDYDGVIVHHAGTKREGDHIVTSGGRVLYVTGLGETVDEAAAKAYVAIGEDGIHFADMQYRTDIGHQARQPK